MRLTIKLSDGNYFPLADDDNTSLGTDQINAINKLGQLEDIEDDLGIDLIILFKAFKNGIWSKGGYYGSCCLDNEPKFIESRDLELGFDYYFECKGQEDYEDYIKERDVLCLYTHDYEDKQYSVKVKDYGRTWALTKEELK